jgi:hypothetical protein
MNRNYKLKKNLKKSNKSKSYFNIKSIKYSPFNKINGNYSVLYKIIFNKFKFNGLKILFFMDYQSLDFIVSKVLNHYLNIKI